MVQNKIPLVLVILDGWGYSDKKIGNPIAAAKTPVMDSLRKEYPMTLLQASGPAVGMTWGEAGNSEVGHMNIGAGRIVEQYLSRINRAIADRTFFSNPALAGAFDHARSKNSKMHIIGLLTSGTAHADFSHIPALFELARQNPALSQKELGLGGQAADNNQLEVYLHLFLDGKDSGLQEGLGLITKLDEQIQRIGCGKIATVIGRNFAMDRDNNWDLTKKAHDLLTGAVNDATENLYNTIQAFYEKGLNDSKIPPTVVKQSGFTGIADGDALIFFNFREDSMRQLVRPFVEQDFSFFAPKALPDIYVCTMTQYLDNPKAVVVIPPPQLPNGLAETLSAKGKTQLHIAETEKYAHVAYFFNGLRMEPFSGETDVFMESIKNYEQNPVMKSREITQRVIEEIKADHSDFILMNYANPDMLAHTGNFEAAVKGIEAVDAAIGEVKNTVLAAGGTLIVTADHGNAESMTYRSSGEVETRHDESPVPFFLISMLHQTAKDESRMAQEVSETPGILADVAPTVLELMGIQQSADMTGKSLLPQLATSA